MKFLFVLLMILPSRVFALDAHAKKLVVIGDSITEGFGVKRDLAYPSVLQKKIEHAHKNWRVINSGISGSTSASALSRVTWHLKQKPDLIVLALGANDGLRGSDVKAMEENLNKAVEAAKKAGVKVILAGIKVPPNYGAAYASAFEAVFPRVAQKNDVPLIPFLLDKVGGDQSLNLEDGIHPNEKGHAIIAETVYQAIRKYL
jgi:acyl-CoA thioesterase-1